MDLLIIHSPAESLRNHPDPAVIYLMKHLVQLIIRQVAEIIAHQAVHMLLQRTDGLHQSAFEIGADTHNLAGSLHLGSQGTLGTDELVERQTGHLYHAVIQHGFEACVGFLRYGVLDLIQSVA